MSEWAPPSRCPDGHPMEHPNVLVGWAPCTCPIAVEEQEVAGGKNPPGHGTRQCLTDKYEWREDGCEDKGTWHQLPGTPTGPFGRPR